MNRRDLIKTAGLTAFYANLPVILSELLSACQSGDQLPHTFFSDAEFKTLEEVIDILLPATGTPSGREVQVPAFVDKITADCLPPEDQEALHKGLQDLDRQDGRSFHSLSTQDKQHALETLDKNAYQDLARPHWFRILKKTALIGYFTSQKGMTEALNYVKVPGDYKGCIPYKPGEKAMAKTFLMY